MINTEEIRQKFEQQMRTGTAVTDLTRLSNGSYVDGHVEKAWIMYQNVVVSNKHFNVQSTDITQIYTVPRLHTLTNEEVALRSLRRLYEASRHVALEDNSDSNPEAVELRHALAQAEIVLDNLTK